MTDELIERIVSENLAAMAGQSPAHVLAIAFAALKPGDDLPNGLHVETSQFWRGVSDENNMLVARHAAEEMRERCALKVLFQVGPDKPIENEALRKIAAAIRALSVEPEHD